MLTGSAALIQPDLGLPDLGLVIELVETVQDLEKSIPRYCALSQSIREHVSGVEPDYGCQNAMVQQFPKELNMAKQ